MATACRALLLALLSAASVMSPVQADTPAGTRVKRVGTLRAVSFEANRGQTDRRVRFLARANGYQLYLTPSEAVFRFTDSRQPDAAMRLRLKGANVPRHITGVDQLPGKSHYFRGSDPREWTTDVPSFARVRYEEIYHGIDVVYYAGRQRLEYDFVVAAGADPRVIRMEFAGARAIRIDANGDLVLNVGTREVRQPTPFAYQDVAGVRRPVPASYAIQNRGIVGLSIGEYDASVPLTIDPVLIYSTYLGGPDELFGAQTIAADDTGAAYVAGSTTSPSFPTTPGALRETNNGGGQSCGNCDAFVTKYDADGAVVYSTYLGGHGTNQVAAIVVDPSGAAYAAGNTTAVDFPTTAGALQPACTQHAPGVPAAGTCNVGFVAKLHPSGASLMFSTYLGGAGVNVTGYGSYPNAIELDPSLNIFLSGSTSPEFPVTPGAFQPTYVGSYVTGFVTKMNASGSALIYSSYLGGHAADFPVGIAVDGSGNAYVTGEAKSTDFPTTPGAFQRTCPIVDIVGGCSIAFVTKINGSGSAIVYSTLLGGTQTIGTLTGISSRGRDVAVDGDGFAYVVGMSLAADFPSTPGALKPTTTTWDAFVTKLNLDGTGLVYSTNLGGDVTDAGASGFEMANGIRLDATGSAYVVGSTSTFDFPQVDPVQPAFGFGFRDVFVARLNPAGSSLLFSTYLGGSGDDEGNGIDIDAAGNIYVTGLTASADFPTSNAAQPTAPASRASFVTKIGEPTCGSEISGQVGVFRSAFYPIFWPFNLQLVILWNPTAAPIEGPVAYVMDDLRNAVFVGPLKTRCLSPEGDPLTLVPLGDDNVLAPNEAKLMGLWFFQTQLAPISYTPRLLSGKRNY